MALFIRFSYFFFYINLQPCTNLFCNVCIVVLLDDGPLFFLIWIFLVLPIFMNVINLAFQLVIRAQLVSLLKTKLAYGVPNYKPGWFLTHCTVEKVMLLLLLII